MQKRILCVLLCLVMVMGLLPTAAFAAEQDASSAVYVSSSGDDTTGDGTESSPYATLAKAVKAAQDGATIYVMSNLTMEKCARFFDKHLTITSGDGGPYTITRAKGFKTQVDNARDEYNPAMIEVQSSKDETESVGLTLKNIILDDANLSEGTVFAQASSEEGHGDNTVYVQDAIIASNATVPCTITLSEGAVLRNFGGMSALRATDKAKIVMESGSVIEDTENLTRTKGTGTDTLGPAGAVWIQDGTLEMKEGSKIQNVNGRAVYADGGTVTIGGTISGITANKSAMWQADNGTAIHLRNTAEGTLTSTALIEDISGGSAVYCADGGKSFEMKSGSKITDCPNLNGNVIYAQNCTITIDGEISNVNATGQHILQTAGGTTVTIGKNGAILNNHAHYGAIYINGTNERLNICGKINGNICTDRGGGVVLSNNGGTKNATMYSGAEISGNYCAETGGGVMVSKGTFTMEGGTISKNAATCEGGGVFVRNGGSFIMNGGTISENATVKWGGGVCFDASDYGGMVPKAELNGGTIENNLMNATITVNKDATVTVSGGSSNDLAISSKDYGKADRYLYISDDTTVGNKAVYFQTGDKTVTPADDSLDIKLGNASTANVMALTTASTAKGWGNPLATFWAQRGGAAKLTVGGLTGLDSNLPVYVLALPVDEDGAAETNVDAQVYAATKGEAGTVSFSLPDISGSGYAIAIVQPTQDYGTLTISGPATLQENETGSDYSVTYTVNYDVSESMKNIIEQDEKVSYSLTINQDSRLDGTPDTTTFDGQSIKVTYTLPVNTFKAGESLFTSAELTITAGRTTYTIPSNVAETQMVGLDPDDDDNDDWSSLIPSIVIAASQNATPLKLNTAEHMAYVNGYPDGTVKPNGNITRAEVAAILYRIMDAKCVSAYSSTTSGFRDVDSGKWYNTYVATLNNAGIITDSQSGYFRPDDAITRAELAAMLGQFVKNRRAANYFSDVSADHWAAIDIAVCANMGWITGYPDGTFRPDATITRAEMMAMVNRALERTPESKDDLLSGMKTWSDNASTSAWYYLDVQEATNGHTYTKSGTKETWTQLTSNTSF